MPGTFSLHPLPDPDNSASLSGSAGSAWKVASSGGGAANPPQFLFASGKRQLTIKPGTVLRKADGGTFDAPAIIDLGFTPTPGKDYCVHIANDGTFRIGLAKITDGTAALIGGFHALCAAVPAGTTYDAVDGAGLAHPLAGYAAGDILPASVWCLNHRPYSEPEGMVYVDSLGFWCDIYLASGTGVNTKSAYQGVISRARTISDFAEDFMLVRKELLSDTEFSAAMLGSNEKTSVAGASEAGATDGGAGGRSDTAGRRMISIYGVEEGCGSLWQFVNEITTNEVVMPGWVSAGNKGSHYRAGAVFAGGLWMDGAICGSRCRSANPARSIVSSSIGGRGRSRQCNS